MRRDLWTRPPFKVQKHVLYIYRAEQLRAFQIQLGKTTAHAKIANHCRALNPNPKTPKPEGNPRSLTSHKSMILESGHCCAVAARNWVARNWVFLILYILRILGLYGFRLACHLPSSPFNVLKSPKFGIRGRRLFTFGDRWRPVMECHLAGPQRKVTNGGKLVWWFCGHKASCHEIQTGWMQFIREHVTSWKHSMKFCGRFYVIHFKKKTTNISIIFWRLIIIIFWNEY